MNMLYNKQHYPGNKELHCISNQMMTFFKKKNLYLLCSHSHSIPPEVSCHRQEVHRKHVSGYDYFSCLSADFRSIKVHMNVWTSLQKHKQLRLNSRVKQIPAQHDASWKRLQVLVPDQATKTLRFWKAFSDNPIFLTSKPKAGLGAPSVRPDKAGKYSSFRVSHSAATSSWANSKAQESRASFNKAFFAGTVDLLKQTFCRNTLFLVKHFKTWDDISGWNQQVRGAGLIAQQHGEAGRARI